MADPAAERLGRLVDAFQNTFIPPLLAGLDEVLVEFFPTEAEARARTTELMVNDLASRLPRYTQIREAFRTIRLATTEASNLEVDLMPFATAASDDAFKALVACCYTMGAPKDCTKFNPKGWYAVYNRNAAVEKACIEGVIAMMNAILVQPTDADCEEYKRLLEAQRAALAGGPVVGGGGGGGGHIGGRRSRRRGRKARKNRSRRQ